MTDVLVIGGGASGLMAAIQAARRGASVEVLEAGRRPAEKILRTGNGHCNLSNEGNLAAVYRGTDPDFAQKVVARVSPSEVRAFFRDIGVPTISRDGWIYPRSMEAESVRGALLREAERLGVRIRNQAAVSELTYRRSCFTAFTDTWQYEAARVILSCGSCASLCDEKEKDHAETSFPGLQMAKHFGHTIVPVCPALTGICIREPYGKKWAGVRVPARVTLLADGQVRDAETGEVQLASYGVSGMPVFGVSAYLQETQRRGERCALTLEFLPDLTHKETEALLVSQLRAENVRCAEDALTGVIPSKLISPVLSRAGIRDGRRAIGEREKEQTAALLAGALKRFPLTPVRTTGFSRAQTVSGGVLTSEICPDTMESRLQSGLYLTGELLDIDGNCGGWNLQFAWSTGTLAGRAASRKL